MNPSDSRSIRRHAGFEVVLGFVIVAIRKVIQAEIQFDNMVDLFGQTQIEHGEPGGRDGRVIAIQAIVVDRAHAKRSAPSVPGGKRHGGIGNEMRRAIYVHAMVASLIKSIRNFGYAATERQMPRQIDRCLHFVSISAAGTLKFEASIIRNVYELVRVVYQENVSAEGKAS